VLRRILLVFLAMPAIHGCAIMEQYRESEFHRDREFYRQYRPPKAIGAQTFGSPVTAQPDRIQLINGDGFAYRPRGQQRRLNFSLASYFLPDDRSPFASAATASSIEYYYCELGATPRLCGARITYESEEVQQGEVLSRVRRTNHERIIDALVQKHGRPQISAGTKWAGTNTKTERFTLVFTEEPSGTITRRDSELHQHRIWCDFSGGLPRQCRRSIVALFQPDTGRGLIFYIDEDLFRYALYFEKAFHHQHPAMKSIKSRPRFFTGLRPLITMSLPDQEWWISRLFKSSPHRFLHWEHLPTEIALDVQARESGKPRLQIARKMSQSEFQREWITAWIGLVGGPSVARAYWSGYLEALVARDFDHRNYITDEAHIKLTVTSRQVLSTVNFVADGYIDGLKGIRNPQYGDSTMPNWRLSEFNCCEDTGMVLLRKLEKATFPRSSELR